MLKKPALAEIADLQERGYAEIENPLDGDVNLGLAMLNKADVCSECIGEMARHPVVRLLRQNPADEALTPPRSRVGQDINRPPVVKTKPYNGVDVQVPRERRLLKRRRAVT